MGSAKWVLAGWTVLLLAGSPPAQEQPGQDAQKRDLAALQGTWEKLPSGSAAKQAAGRLLLRIKGEDVDLLVPGEGGAGSAAALRLQVGEVKGIKVLALRLLGQSEVIAYSVDGDSLVLAAGRTLFGRGGISLRGEWVRVKPGNKQ